MNEKEMSIQETLDEYEKEIFYIFCKYRAMGLDPVSLRSKNEECIKRVKDEYINITDAKLYLQDMCNGGF